MTLPAATDLGFVETLKEPIVLVDFWADWCQPCQILKPIVAQIADELRGRVTIVGAHIDEVPQMMEYYEVKTIPTLVYIRNGQEVHRTNGPTTRAKILEDLHRHLGV